MIMRSILDFTLGDLSMVMDVTHLDEAVGDDEVGHVEYKGNQTEPKVHDIALANAL